MNKVILIGNLGKDPEIRQSQSGQAIANFSLATTKKVKGEKVTDWHRCVAFGKTAEVIGKYVSKGAKLAIDGSISYGSYEKEGTKVYTTDIIVNNIEFLSANESVKANGQVQEAPDLGEIPF